MSTKQFEKAFKRIDKAIKASTVSTLNKALSATHTKVKKELRTETGLSNDEISERIRVYKATQKNPKASIRIAIKVGIHLSKMKAQVKRVTATVRNAYSKPSGIIKKAFKSKFYGASVKIGKQPRQLVPGGFLATTKRGKLLVLARKEAVDADGTNYVPNKVTSKRPTIALRTKVFSDAAKRIQEECSKYMKQYLSDNYTEQLQANLSKKLDDNN